MSVLLDTNILTRSAQPGHPMHNEALDALDTLRRQGEELCIVPQNLYEFWAVATRPLAANGLGMAPSVAESELTQIKQLFRLLDDTPAVYTEWENWSCSTLSLGKTHTTLASLRRCWFIA